jgi:hypothetical protein
MRSFTKKAVLALALCGLMAAVNAWALKDANTVRAREGRLSVHVQGLPLGELLEAVKQETGINFLVDASLKNKKVFLSFRGLELLEGIKRIVQHLDSVFIYDSSGRLNMVYLLGTDGVPTTKPAVRADPATATGQTTPSGRPRGPAVKGRALSADSAGVDGPPMDRAYEGKGPPSHLDRRGSGPPKKKPGDREGPPTSGPKENSGDGPPGADKKKPLPQGPPGAR